VKLSYPSMTVTVTRAVTEVERSALSTTLTIILGWQHLWCDELGYQIVTSVKVSVRSPCDLPCEILSKKSMSPLWKPHDTSIISFYSVPACDRRTDGHADLCIAMLKLPRIKIVEIFDYILFLPPDAMHSADYSVARCLSVWPSVCHTPVFCRN